MKNPLTQVRLTRTEQLRSWIAVLLLLSVFLIILLIDVSTEQRINNTRMEYDRLALQEFFAADSYDNDLLLDSLLLSATEPQPGFVNKDLLGLKRDRLAYIARKDGEVVAVAVPATAEDGFNGFVDLLLSVDMSGHILAARVVRYPQADSPYGVVDVVESQWMKGFAGNAMRDMRRISWQTISAENEYDQFVGASITPKAVADRIYNALLFFLSNRMVLMQAVKD